MISGLSLKPLPPMVIDCENQTALFIRVENGQPVDHPVIEWNLRMFHPDLDPHNPPAPYEKFNRVDPPDGGRWSVIEQLPYAKVDGVWSDVFSVRAMTEEEKDAVRANIRAGFVFADQWTFDEDKCEWIPPVPYPTDGKQYYWDVLSRDWTTDLDKAKQNYEQRKT